MATKAIEKVNPLHERAISYVMENPFATIDDLAQLCDVSARTIRRWKSNPVFSQRLVDDARAALHAALPHVYYVLQTKALEGDARFMKMMLDHLERVEELQRDITQENTFIVQWNNTGEKNGLPGTIG